MFVLLLVFGSRKSPAAFHLFDESIVPPWKRGDFRGILGVTQNLMRVVDRVTYPGAARPLSLR